MDIDLVLNELSMQNPANDIQTARQRMSEFIATIRQATFLGIKSLRIHHEFYNEQLSNNYPLARWLNDMDVDRDEKLFLKSLATKRPFLQGINDSNLQSKTLLSEFKHEGKIAEGLGVTLLIEGLAVSVNSDEKWNSNFIILEVTTFDDDGILFSESEKVNHAMSASQVLEHKQWIQQRLKATVHDGADMWARRQELLPSLSFCEGLEDVFQTLLSNHQMLKPVTNRLLELENHCKNWIEGPFDFQALPSKASQESEATLTQYCDERTFCSPEGEAILFSWHVRLTPNEWRIYFLPKPETRTILVGYIGQHLRTAKFPK